VKDENGSLVVDQRLLNRSLNLLAASEAKDPLDEASLCLAIAYYYQENSNESQAEKQIDQMNRILGKLTSNINRTKPLPPIAEAYRQIGITQYERLSNLYNRAGVIRSRQKKWDKAAKAFTWAVQLQEASGNVNLDMSTYLSNLADGFYGQERYKEAEKCQREALLISQQELGPVDKQVADNLRSLAWIAEKACPFYKNPFIMPAELKITMHKRYQYIN
jgi:tetratricopeptide (TPR) repeat protein